MANPAVTYEDFNAEETTAHEEHIEIIRQEAEWFDLTVKNQIITLDNGDCIISFKYENGKIEYISKDKLAFDHAEIIAKAIELL